MKKKTIPTYEFLIDDSEESGVKAVAIVINPAFQSKLISFSKKIKPIFLALKDDKKKQICAGLSLIPNVPIYRIDEEVGEYYGFFSAETIEKIVEKYHSENLGNVVNLDHDDNEMIDAFLIEDYIVNSESRVADLKAMGIEHENIMGSWYTAFKIKDPEVFSNILIAQEEASEMVGFSVESFLDRVIVDFNNQVKNNYINSKIKTEMTKTKKTLKEKILAIFASEIDLERALVPELAFEIEWSEVGAPVNKVVVSTEGVETLELVGQGEFITESGIVVTDEASNLVEVRDLPAEPEVEVEVETAVEEPEVLVVSDDPSTTGSTENMSATLIQFATDMSKRLSELIPTDKAGSYNICIDVNDKGEYTWGSMSSYTSLKLASETRIGELEAQNKTLLEKIAEPITEPILEPVPVKKEWAKMSAYEKLMHNKGLSAI